MARILVVDDDKLIGVMVKHTLALKGHEVLVCQDSKKIIPYILDNNIDLVLLDRLLLAQDGLDVCYLLKKNSATATIPVIIMSALSDIQTECENAGATDFLEKPFNIQDLFLKTENALEKESI